MRLLYCTIQLNNDSNTATKQHRRGRRAAVHSREKNKCHNKSRIAATDTNKGNHVSTQKHFMK